MHACLAQGRGGWACLVQGRGVRACVGACSMHGRGVSDTEQGWAGVPPPPPRPPASSSPSLPLQINVLYNRISHAQKL